jgi:hypothetical protein
LIGHESYSSALKDVQVIIAAKSPLAAELNNADAPIVPSAEIVDPVAFVPALHAAVIVGLALICVGKYI